MKRLIITLIICMLPCLVFDGCSTSRRTRGDMRGLMLLDNVQLGRNKAFYSKHNVKARKDASKHYKRSR